MSYLMGSFRNLSLVLSDLLPLVSWFLLEKLAQISPKWIQIKCWFHGRGLYCWIMICLRLSEKIQLGKQVKIGFSVSSLILWRPLFRAAVWPPHRKKTGEINNNGGSFPLKGGEATSARATEMRQLNRTQYSGVWCVRKNRPRGFWSWGGWKQHS